MKAIWNGQVIAESDDMIEIEGNQYFPPESINKEFLANSTYTTTCPWKGEAHYYNLTDGNQTSENVAWYYPVPKEGSAEKVGQDFARYVAFGNGVVVA